jgi:hypothetical protein
MGTRRQIPSLDGQLGEKDISSWKAREAFLKFERSRQAACHERSRVRVPEQARTIDEDSLRFRLASANTRSAPQTAKGRAIRGSESRVG